MDSHDGPGAARTGAAARKDAVRRTVLARRAAVDPDVRSTWDTALRHRLAGLVRPGTQVFAYVPTVGEAGGRTLPAALAAEGAAVWLPVSPVVGPLGWARFRGEDDLRPGRYGIPVPSPPVGPPEALADADLVLVPALAVDRTGTRLGRGGGYYDRSLVHAPPTARLLAVLDDDDVLDHVPGEAHDVRVHGVVTPTRVLDLGDWHSAG